MKKLERILEAAAAGSAIMLGFCTILFLMLCMGPTSSIAKPLAYAWLVSFCCMALLAALAVAVAKYNENNEAPPIYDSTDAIWAKWRAAKWEYADMFPHDYSAACGDLVPWYGHYIEWRVEKSAEKIKEEEEILRLYATIPTVRRTESRENDMQTKALYLIDTAEYYYAKNNFDRALEAIVKAESWREKLESPFVHAERLAQIKQKVNKSIK